MKAGALVVGPSRLKRTRGDVRKFPFARVLIDRHGPPS
jgi:hypothetical protein